MKLWILSDLHVDVNRRFPFELPTPHPAHDVVIIAGDICQGLAEGVRFIASQELNAKPVIYVAGNHEFYGHDRHGELADGRSEAARHPNIHLLERDSVVIDGVAFLGCTLWTDYKYAGMREQARAMHWAARRISDHRLISAGKGAWSPEQAADGARGLAQAGCRISSRGARRAPRSSSRTTRRAAAAFSRATGTTC